MNKGRIEEAIDQLSLHFPGWVVCTIITGASYQLSVVYPLSPVLLAIMFGMSFTFLTNDYFGCKTGIDSLAGQLLKIAVALMGASISIDVFMNMRVELILLMSLVMVLTVFYMFHAAKLLKVEWRIALLTAIPVVICGPTAAVAVASILPRYESSEKDLAVTVISLTALTTCMMFTYPGLAVHLEYSVQETAMLLAATVHSVSGAVGAAIAISPEVGDVTVLTKLFRVSLLAPVMILTSLYIRVKMTSERVMDTKPAIVPSFIIAFMVFAFLNTVGVIPSWLQEILSKTAAFLFTLASAAIGLKSSLGKAFADGGFIFLLVLSGTMLGTVLMVVSIQLMR